MRTAHRPNPDDFISLLSSEDEAPLNRKRKYSVAEQASAGRNRDSQGRAKRVRTSQVPGDSITGAKGLKAGKLEVVEGSDIGIPAFGSHGEKKKTGGFSPDSVFLPKSPPMFTLHSISLQLPVFAPQREGTWLTRFTEWAQLLCSANRDSPSAAEITPALIRTAYKQYIDIHSRLKSNKKRAARLVAQQFKDSSLLDLIRAFRPLQNEATVQETLEEEQSGALYILDVAPQLPQDATMCETIPASQQGSQPASQLDLLPEPQPKHLRQTQHASVKVTMSLPSAVPSGAEALRQQRLYFPSARDPFNMCLLCGAEGHVADKCTRSCQLCGKKDHWDLCCPLWQANCGKCYRVGHSDEACWYPEEHYWVFCTYCRSAESHLSSDCMSLYRSFRPGPDTIKKVNTLPVSCAKCGSKKHFHGDCRPNGMPALRCDHRFHLDNMRQYLDPTSSAGPIIGADACRVAPKAGGFRVYGQVLASPVDNVHYYSGSDDSDEGLCVVTSTVPSRSYNCEPPPPCLQSPPSATYHSPPTRQSSPSLGSLSSRDSSPYRPPTPPPHPVPSRRGGGGGRRGRGGHHGGPGRQQGQSGQAAQDVQRRHEEQVQGGQHVQSGQGEQTGRGGRRGRGKSGKSGKRGGQKGQDGQGHHEGPDVHNIQGVREDENGPGQQNGQGKRGKKKPRRGRRSSDGHQ
ncbi:hypothetical protein M419DRAFT_81949 [Trichoderma reesei RUT C-30]|uniref:CCHC-type domain-containing protein n=1 Tax=Hypocrea jecorina (strain ATCC 56765 / BCRC 32924 / NRRL 11460 / Rut C-30) TaxID=1344414 RepID=A0A024S723_HYPJR|nr:hypothetical protein M419DRAFT_81949 [Trichoderma reesei RUT C-30]